jgi:hypothetical protein
LVEFERISTSLQLFVVVSHLTKLPVSLLNVNVPELSPEQIVASELISPPKLIGSTVMITTLETAREQTPDLGIALNLVVVVRLLNVCDIDVLEIFILLAQLLVVFFPTNNITSLTA